MPDYSVPFWVYLGVLPLWGTPICIVYWAVRGLQAGERRKALSGLLRGLGAWLVITLAYFAVSFVIAPCLEGCSKFDTPEHNAAQFAILLLYTAAAATLVVRLYRSGRAPVQEGVQPPLDKSAT